VEFHDIDFGASSSVRVSLVIGSHPLKPFIKGAKELRRRKDAQWLLPPAPRQVNDCETAQMPVRDLEQDIIPIPCNGNRSCGLCKERVIRPNLSL
jgi:hypothetical protein